MARRRRHKSSGSGFLGLLALGAIGLIVEFISKHPAEIVIAIAIGVVLWIAYLIFRPKDVVTSPTASPAPPPYVQEPAPPVAASRQTIPAPDTAVPSFRIPVPPENGHRASIDGSQFWRKPGADATLEGRSLGSMIYIGTGLTSISGGAPEPALIDPNLKVDHSVTECQVQRLTYWPSYSDASQQARAAYLNWLSNLRRDANADIGYVFLFFYGLERRALHDVTVDPAAVSELPTIEAEMNRLLGIYGQQRSFNSYATHFLDFLAVKRNPKALYRSPPLLNSSRQLTYRDRLALAQCAADQSPLPAVWALHWLQHDPNTSLATPARRCPHEFARLFEILYRESYAEGLILPINRTKLKFQYQPASASFRGAPNSLIHSTELPDVTVLTAPLKKLADLATQTCDRLARFSRVVGKDPTAAQSFEALVELPVALWPEEYRHPLEAVRDVVARAGQPAAIPFAKFRTWIPEFNALTRAKLKALTTALAGVGLGMEPDLRFGGGAPAFESRVVLFADDPTTAAEEASAQYLAAALTLQLAAAVAAADGSVAEIERTLIIRQMNEWLNLTESERRRLQALLRLLLTEPPKLTGLKKKIDTLKSPARQAIGDFLVMVAQADNQVTPEEIRTLQKIFGLLGLDPDAVYSKVHAASLLANELATAAPIPPKPAEFVIPRPAARSGRPAKQTGITLDPQKIAARQRESDRVAHILASVFETPSPEPEATDIQSSASDPPDLSPRFLDLDAIHSALLVTLTTRQQWTREELNELADDRGLMLEGALERLNEACFDKLDMPLFDDADPLILNPEALTGVLRAQHPQS